jgi:hypothetical protein
MNYNIENYKLISKLLKYIRFTNMGRTFGFNIHVNLRI